MKKNIILFSILLLLPFYHCKKSNPIDTIVNAFDEASDKIVDQSISWQNTLKDLENKVKNDVSDIIRNDLTYLVQTSIASAGVELRCNAQYFRDGLRREIRRLKNRFLAENGLAPFQVTYLPNVCHVLPNIITPTTTSIEVYGYDLLKEHINVYLESADGSRQLISKNTTNNNSFVSFNSHFQLTIDLGGLNGLPLVATNKKISIECPSCDSDHKFISEVSFHIPVPQQVRTNIFGGSGGSVFIDELEPLKVKRISGVRIRYNTKVDAIAVVWQQYTTQINEYDWKWSVWRGGFNNVGVKDTIISFNPDEEWIGISGKSGSVIDQILLQTTKRIIGPFGGTGGTQFNLLDQGQIVGIHGRSGSYLDAIGLIVRK